jgi:hypothetical protein
MLEISCCMDVVPPEGFVVGGVDFACFGFLASRPLRF